ncbi:MAG: hypothetical protein QOG62_1003 [Thermoleophilaceae bacterium]|nr:hypothetical protein [Thermoleophilaceae bacterium]
MKLRIGLIASALTLALPSLAAAHVTVQPNEVPAGGYTRLDVRVPNETDDAATSKVEVQFPDGFAGVQYEPVPGWSVDIQTEKLDTPITTDDGDVTEQVKTVTWTADDDQSMLQPGAFQDFGLSVKIPDGAAGSKLTFPALQTYDNGDVVRWIGDESSEEPAPTVTLEPAEAEDAHAAMSGEDTAGQSAPAAAMGDHLALVGVILGGLALLLALVALFRRR